MAANRSIKVKVLSEEKPSSAQIRALTDFKMQAVEQFPELSGQIYAELNKLRQDTLSDKSVGGFYSPSEKKIFIAKGLPPDMTREVVAMSLRMPCLTHLGEDLGVRQRRLIRRIWSTGKQILEPLIKVLPERYRITQKRQNQKRFQKRLWIMQ